LNAALGTGGGSAPDPGPFPSSAFLAARYAADNPDNTVETTDINFATTDVDTAGNKIVITAPYKAPGSTNAQRARGSRVYFSSTGTLPAPLVAGTAYFISPVSGGFRIYPLATTSDTIPGFFAGETISESTNWALGINPIVLTTQGSGTHRIYSNPLAAVIADLSGNGFTCQCDDLADRNTMLEIITDGSGRKAFRSRMIYDDLDVGFYNSYGKGYVQGPPGAGGKRLEARTNWGANKRCAVKITVMRIEPRRKQSIAKTKVPASQVDTGNNRILTTNPSVSVNSFTNLDLVRVKLAAGATIPSPLVEGQDYYCTVSGLYITLYPTYADAVAATNAVVLTTQGSGSFWLYAPARVADNTRWGSISEWVQTDDVRNVMRPQTERDGPASSGILAFTNIFTAANGTSNGQFGNTSLNTSFIQVKFWWPPGCTPPICSDTGLPLGEGPFYVSKPTAGSSVIRIHRDLVSAQASDGLTTNSLADNPGSATANRWCIKFPTAAVPTVGSFYIRQEDGCCDFSIAQAKNTTTPRFGQRVPMDQVLVLLTKIDYDNPAQANPYATLGVNAANTIGLLLSGTKGNTTATVFDGPGWTEFNSTALHVAFHGDIYDDTFYSSVGEITDADMSPAVDWFKAKRSIAA